MIDRRDFDYKKIYDLTEADTEPIQSQFRLSINTVLNLIDQHPPEEIEKIILQSFYAYQHKKTHFPRTFQKIKKKLEKMHYVENNNLTEKGKFTAAIYADELQIGEIFATEFWHDLNEYQILLLIASLCYEGRERTKFYKTYVTTDVKSLYKKLDHHDFLRKEKRFEEIENMTALIYPAYKGESLNVILEATTLEEGDVIRIYRQMLDRLGQVRGAATDDHLILLLRGCMTLIGDTIKNIDVI